MGFIRIDEKFFGVEKAFFVEFRGPRHLRLAMRRVKQMPFMLREVEIEALSEEAFRGLLAPSFLEW